MIFLLYLFFIRLRSFSLPTLQDSAIAIYKESIIFNKHKYSTICIFMQNKCICYHSDFCKHFEEVKVRKLTPIYERIHA